MIRYVFSYLFVCTALTPVFATTTEYWKAAQFKISEFESYILSEATCLASEDHYVGCRTAFQSALDSSELSRENTLAAREAARADFNRGTKAATQKLRALNFWPELRKRFPELKKDAIYQSRLMAEIYNMFLLHAYDPHTHIQSLEEFGEDNGSDAVAVGIGIGLMPKDNDVIVVHVYAGSPADRAGIKAGDIIRGVNNFVSKGPNASEVSERLRSGTTGSKVTVHIQRGATAPVQSFALTRESITQKAFIGQIREYAGKRYGHLKVTNFSDFDSIADTKLFFYKEESEKIDGYILDLRDNPGGYMQYAKSLVSAFLPDPPGSDYFNVRKEIYMTGPLISNVFFAAFSSVEQKTKLPMITLVNASTASAAEMTAAVLQKEERSLVLGERTFGKATQQVGGNLDSLAPGFERAPKSVLKRILGKAFFYRTASLFYTKDYWTHQLRGVQPDFEVEDQSRALAGLKALREEDLFVNAVPPRGKEINPRRPEHLEKIEALRQLCLTSNASRDAVEAGLEILKCTADAAAI